MSVHFGRIGQLLRYYPWPTGMALVIGEAARKLFDPHAQPSYSQSGEDRVLSAWLDLSRPGFYVDVGCHHPFKGSNTAGLYSRGWRGLAIDGNPDLVRRFRRARPRDICECAIVSDREAPMTLAIARQPEFSTVSAEFEGRWIRPGDVVRRLESTAVRLQTLLRRHGVPRVFDLLSVDVEGHDYEVLTSFDIEEYRPRVVVIELHDLDLENLSPHPVCAYLNDHGYRLRSYTQMNGLFIDRRA